MRTFVLDFIPPLEGMEGIFNTIRLGGVWAKKLTTKEQVFLLDNKLRAVVGRAKVLEIHTGKILDLCKTHGALNHTQLGQDGKGASERLYSIVVSIYGPHIVHPDKLATVILLERLPDRRGTQKDKGEVLR